MQCPKSLLLGPLLLLATACGDGAGPAAAAGGSAPATAAAGSGSSAGGSSAPTAGGSTAAGGGGAGSVSVPLAGSGQAIGGGDQGALFDVAVEVMPQAGGGMAAGGAGGGSGIPGDGKSATSMIRGALGGTALFVQTGEDVMLVVNLTNCADGNHQFRIHDGYSCDNPSTEGMPWGARGTGIGPESGIACSGGKGTLMYTRSGSDKTKNWTVADHAQATDITAHVVIVSDQNDPNSRAACGNFF